MSSSAYNISFSIEILPIRIPGVKARNTNSNWRTTENELKTFRDVSRGFYVIVFVFHFIEFYSFAVLFKVVRYFCTYLTFAWLFFVFCIIHWRSTVWVLRYFVVRLNCQFYCWVTCLFCRQLLTYLFAASIALASCSSTSWLQSCMSVAPVASGSDTGIPIAEDIQLVTDTGRRPLRSAAVRTCFVSRTHNSFGDRSFSAAGPHVWNSFQPNIRQDMTFARFQHKRKTFLLVNHSASWPFAILRQRNTCT